MSTACENNCHADCNDPNECNCGCHAAITAAMETSLGATTTRDLGDMPTRGVTAWEMDRGRRSGVGTRLPHTKTPTYQAGARRSNKTTCNRSGLLSACLRAFFKIPSALSGASARCRSKLFVEGGEAGCLRDS